VWNLISLRHFYHLQWFLLLKMAVSTSHVVVGIFLIIYSSIDPINITLPFSLIMCCNIFPPYFSPAGEMIPRLSLLP